MMDGQSFTNVKNLLNLYLKIAATELFHYLHSYFFIREMQ